MEILNSKCSASIGSFNILRDNLGIVDLKKPSYSKVIIFSEDSNEQENAIFQIKNIVKISKRNAYGLLRLKLEDDEKARINGILKCATNYERNIKSYCKNRICPICNGLKGVRLSKKYYNAILKLEAPVLLTLTLPSVFKLENNLNEVLNNMFNTYRKLKDSLRKKGIKIIGIRKLEIVINSQNRTFNPHFHLIIDNPQNEASLVAEEWLKRNSSRGLKGQIIQPIIEGDEMIILKYLSKPFVHFKNDNGDWKKDYEMLLMVYRATFKRRVFKNYGGFKSIEV